jgi:hypothetical protein
VIGSTKLQSSCVNVLTLVPVSTEKAVLYVGLWSKVSTTTAEESVAVQDHHTDGKPKESPHESKPSKSPKVAFERVPLNITTLPERTVALVKSSLGGAWPKVRQKIFK